MKKRVTFTINSLTIKKAKELALELNISLSELVEDFLRNLIKSDLKKTRSKSINKFAGIVKLPKKFNEKKELEKYFTKQHL